MLIERGRDKLILGIICFMIIILAASSTMGATYGPHMRPPALATNGMVSSNNILASQAGVKMLEMGGTVADSMLAVSSVLSLIAGERTSIGGEGISLLYLAKGNRLIGLNHTAPVPSSPELVKRAQETRERYAIMSASVPGNIGGLLALHERYGKLPLSEVFAPAIGYAVNGFPLTKSSSVMLKEMEPTFRLYPTTMAVYLPKGRVPEPGELLYNPNYANTLRIIAKGGREAFYKGPIAREIDRFYKEHNGLLSYEDISAYEPEWTEPIHTTYRGYDIYTMPPTSSGCNIIQELNILEGFDIKSMKHNSADYVHLLIEVFKLAEADRDAYVGDPRFVKVPLEKLISKEYAASQRKRIDMKRALKPAPGLGKEEKGGTTHAVVADQWGNLLSTTPTDGQWGNGILVGNTGIWMADGGRRMNLKKGDPNELKPGKRNQWNMAPTYVFKDGKPIIALGAAGNITIWQTQVQVLLNVIDFGMGLQEAISVPRVSTRVQLQMDSDGGWSEAMLDDLKKRGHKIEITDVGEVNAIAISPNGVLTGAADPRRDAFVVGY